MNDKRLRLLLTDLFGARLSALIQPFCEGLNEIRLRRDKPLYLVVNGKNVVPKLNNIEVVITKDEVERAVMIACGNSIYAVNDSLIKGFLHYKEGVRIGIVGQGVTERGIAISIKNISAICVRIPRAAQDEIPLATQLSIDIKSTLIISPTGCGKTTFLRELTRLSANKGVACAVIDERFELSASVDGAEHMSLGDCADIICGMPKATVYESIVRSINPKIVVTDEVFGSTEIDALLDLMRCGVIVYATAHCATIKTILNDKTYGEFAQQFSRIVCLGGVGKVIDFYDKEN